MTRAISPQTSSPTTGEVERIVPGTPQWEGNYADHIQRYQFVARHMPVGGRILDAGCGCGYGSAHLVDQGARMVVAVDIAPGAIELARQHFDRERIVWLRDDCHTLDSVTPHAPFDLICNLENLEHLSKPESFLARAVQLLKPEGILITSTPNRILMNQLRGTKPDAPSTNPFHQKEFTAQEFDALLRRQFAEVTLWYQCLTPTARARQAFEPVLYAIWANPALQVGRWMQRLLRRKNASISLKKLLPPRDWEILEHDPGKLVTWTFLAVCRKPRLAN